MHGQPQGCRQSSDMSTFIVSPVFTSSPKDVAVSVPCKPILCIISPVFKAQSTVSLRVVVSPVTCQPITSVRSSEQSGLQGKAHEQSQGCRRSSAMQAYILYHQSGLHGTVHGQSQGCRQSSDMSAYIYRQSGLQGKVHEQSQGCRRFSAMQAYN